METEALYQNPDIKLKDLADKLNVSTHFLSQLLNDNLGQSFAQYINTLRVEESKDLIKNNHHFTLEAIGFEAGFSSKSSFYSTFKKITGVTPAMYKRQVS
jgi:YesN/AraC family two-component response regulator